MKRIFVRGILPPKIPSSVAAIGVFDGVHRGHQKVIGRAVAEARRLKIPSVVITFYPHPVEVLSPRIFVPYITTLEHRLRLIEDMGVDICIVIGFSAGFAVQEPESFIRDFLVARLGVKMVVIGRDFHFGRGRKGSVALLKAMGEDSGFKVEQIKIIKNINKNIKTTYIKKLIKKGDLVLVKHFLSRCYAFLGEVEYGDARGRKLGYRTANLKKENVVTLPSGIYIVRAHALRKTHDGLCYIGRRPTFKGRDAGQVMELHLLDYQGDLYGKKILVEFLKKLRDDMHFSDGESLAEQIALDIRKTRRFFARAAFRKAVPSVR